MPTKASDVTPSEKHCENIGIKSHLIFIGDLRLYKRLAGFIRRTQTCRRLTTNALRINHVFKHEPTEKEFQEHKRRRRKKTNER